MESYTLADARGKLVVQTWHDGRNRARLLIDAEEVDSGDTAAIGLIELGDATGLHVRALFRWRGKVSRVALVEKIGGKEMTQRFAPPPGSRAARSYEFEQTHPTLYASRHVAINLGGTILAILGVGALLSALARALLPKIDLPAIDVNTPDWLRYLDPWHYIAPLFSWVPDVDLPNVGWLKYVVGFVVAVGIAAEEAKRRKKRRSENKSGDSA